MRFSVIPLGILALTASFSPFSFGAQALTCADHTAAVGLESQALVEDLTAVEYALRFGGYGIADTAPVRQLVAFSAEKLQLGAQNQRPYSMRQLRGMLADPRNFEGARFGYVLRHRIAFVMEAWARENGFSKYAPEADVSRLRACTRAGFPPFAAAAGPEAVGEPTYQSLLSLPDRVIAQESFWQVYQRGELNFLRDPNARVARNRFYRELPGWGLGLRPRERAVLYVSLRLLMADLKSQGERASLSDVKERLHFGLSSDLQNYFQTWPYVLEERRKIQAPDVDEAERTLRAAGVTIRAKGIGVVDALGGFVFGRDGGELVGDFLTALLGWDSEAGRYALVAVAPHAIYDRSAFDAALDQLRITADYLADTFGSGARFDLYFFVREGARSNSRIAGKYEEKHRVLYPVDGREALRIHEQTIQVRRLPPR